MTELNLIPWPETQQFHQVRKYTHEHSEILNSNPVVKYRCKNKLDGTNAGIRLEFKDRKVFAQSREVVLVDGKDNAGFAKWVESNKDKFVAWMDHFESKLKLQHEQIEEYLLYGEWCFNYSTPILCADGTTKKIKDIVNKKLEIEVMSYNFQTQTVEPKKVIGWSKIKNNVDDWLTIGVERRRRGGRENKLVLTKDHKIFVKQNHQMIEKSAKDLCVGDTVYIFGKQLGYYQMQFMMGSLLGDGSLTDYSFTVSHSESDQPEYNIFIQKMFQSISSAVTRISGHGSNMKGIYTQSLPEIRNLHDLLIIDKVKTPTEEYLNKLHPPALAAWYMDDGGLCSGKNGRQFQSELYTQGFSKEANECIVNWFNKHGFECYLNKIDENKKQYFIRFSPNGTISFQKIIAPYIISYFNYKLIPEFREIPKINWAVEEMKNGLIESKISYIKTGNPGKAYKNVKFDITVEDNHNFFANRTLVHNCGPGIQNRCAISSIDRKVFALFALQPIGSTNDDTLVVDPEVLESYFKNVCPDFYVIPWIDDKEYLVDWSKSSEELQPITEELNALVAEVEKCDPFVKTQFGIEGLGEGFVMFPVSVEHAGKANFTNLANKCKGDKHKTVAQKRSVQVEPETAATASAFAALTLTLARLEQGVRAVSGGEVKFEQKSVGAFLKWIATDVQKECQTELAASNLLWKDVQKSVGDFARNWYLAEMKK